MSADRPKILLPDEVPEHKSIPERVAMLEAWRAHYDSENLPSRMDTTERWQERVGGIYMTTTFFVGAIGTVVGFIVGCLLTYFLK